MDEVGAEGRRRPCFVIQATGVRPAVDLGAGRIDRRGRLVRRVHVRGSRRPVWVDIAQVHPDEDGARRHWRDAAAAGRARGITVVEAAIALGRAAAGAPA